ncbi:MAG: hypothetical protein ABSD20_07245 [Terriglobales bacterium]|jgi:hypothetical protein
MGMSVELTPHAQQVLREILGRQPDQRPEQVVERALDAVAGQSAPAQGLNLLADSEFEAWLDALAVHSSEIPPFPGETFSRESIYRDDEG